MKENQLKELYLYVTRILVNKGKSHLDARDIVHSAFLSLSLSGTLFCFENMKPFISGEINNQQFAENMQVIRIDELGAIGYALKDIEHKHCKNCDCVAPVSFFNKAKVFPNGKICYQTLCKECQAKKSKEARERRANDPLRQQAHLERAKIRQREKMSIIYGNDRLHEYFKSQKRARRASHAAA